MYLRIVKLQLILILMLIGFVGSAGAQLPDFISVKKANGRTVRSYYRDMDIEFTIQDGQRFRGTIAEIYNDSLFLKVYQVQRTLSVWNTPIFDTVNTVLLPFHYQEIKKIFIPNIHSKQRLVSRMGTLLFIGGIGYTLLNLVNSAVKGESAVDTHNVKNLAFALTAAGGGYFLMRQYQAVSSRPGRRSKIVYVKMN